MENEIWVIKNETRKRKQRKSRKKHWMKKEKKNGKKEGSNYLNQLVENHYKCAHLHARVLAHANGHVYK